MNDPFDFPVIFRIEKSTIWGDTYIGHDYVSPGRAIQALKLMDLSKFGDPDKWFLTLVQSKGDQILTTQRINLKTKVYV